MHSQKYFAEKCPLINIMMMMISTIRGTIFCNCFPCCSGFSDCLIPKHRHFFTTLPVYFYSIMLNLEHCIMNYFVISVMNDSWHLPDTQMVHKDKTPLTGWEEETTWQVFRIQRAVLHMFIFDITESDLHDMPRWRSRPISTSLALAQERP